MKLPSFVKFMNFVSLKNLYIHGKFFSVEIMLNPTIKPHKLDHTNLLLHVNFMVSFQVYFILYVLLEFL